MLEGAAQELRGHLTLERVTASKAGDEISVFFSSDMLVEERPFLAAQRAMRRNFAPTRVKMRSVTGIFASFAGTNDPMCAISAISATCRM